MNVTETLDVFGATFDVVYDAGKAEYRNWSAGEVLESGGHQVSYLVNGDQPGRIVVSATRPKGDSGADISGTKVLVNLTLRVTQAGNSQVGFQNADLTDPQDPPLPINGISFSGCW